MESTIEKRILASARIETRADEGEKLVGYAAVFDTETDIGGYFREVVARGAFKSAIGRDDIHALYNHDYGMVIGRKKAGTLLIEEDDHGLRVEITPPNTQLARDLIENIRSGNIDQMSFAFDMTGGRQTWDEAGQTPVRRIEQVGELFEVSIVPRGAYPTTEIALRSLAASRATRSNIPNKRRSMEMKLRGLI